MLKNRNIVCISVPPWQGEYASTIVELMKRIGTSNKVLYVQNPYTVKDVVSAVWRRKKIPYKRIFGISARAERVSKTEGGEVYVLVPPLILTINFLPPGKIYDLFLRFNGWLIRRAIAGWLRRLKMNENLVNVVSFNPILGMVIGRKLGEKTLIYHCYDQIKEAVWMKKHGPAYETSMMKKADAVIVTSKGLLEEKSRFCRKCFLVKNAADVELFGSAFHTEIHSQPTVGFIGSLDNRIDYELLGFVIGSMPEARFIFVGRIVDKQGEQVLRSFKNVELVGARPVSDLPGYLKQFSIGIIPFLKNEFTKGIYPLKINEYLAAGLPVVSTDFSYLDDFYGVIKVSADRETFRMDLLTEMGTDTPEKKQKRREVASQNTWEKRVEEIGGIISSLEA